MSWTGKECLFVLKIFVFKQQTRVPGTKPECSKSLDANVPKLNDYENSHTNIDLSEPNNNNESVNSNWVKLEKTYQKPEQKPFSKETYSWNFSTSVTVGHCTTSKGFKFGLHRRFSFHYQAFSSKIDLKKKKTSWYSKKYDNIEEQSCKRSKTQRSREIN